jgi:hypothetical protein
MKGPRKLRIFCGTRLTGRFCCEIKKEMEA